jgi:ferritin-like protein
LGKIQSDSANTFSLAYDNTVSNDLGTPVLTWNAYNRVGIMNTNPTAGYVLDANGDIRCQSLTQYSDANKKENINDLNLGLDLVTKLRPVSFKWKDIEEVKEYEEVEEDVYEEQEVTTIEKVIELVDGKYVQKEIEKVVKQKVQVFDEVDLYDGQGNIIGKHQVARKQKAIKEVVRKQAETHSRKHFGLLAQEVEQIAKDLGIDMKEFGMLKITNYNNPDAEHEYGLDYTQLIPVLIKAIQELAQKVNS